MRSLLLSCALLLLGGCSAAPRYVVEFNSTELGIMLQERGSFPVELSDGTVVEVRMGNARQPYREGKPE